MPKRNRLLLADNSIDYRRAQRGYLELEDYEVVEAASVREATLKLAAGAVDLALVDLRLTRDDDDSDMSGLEVAKAARERGIPCIIVTMYESVEAARMALRSRGAEPLAQDFFLKKEGPAALLDAVAHVLGAWQEGPTEVPSGIVVDPARGLAWLDGVPLELYPNQYALLAYLYAKQGAVCSAEEVLKVVYGEDVPRGQASADKRLERLVARLREKIEQDPANPRHLLTVPGRGLRLEARDD